MLGIIARPSPVCVPVMVFALWLLTGLTQAMAQESADRHGSPAPSWADAAPREQLDGNPAVAQAFDIAPAQRHVPAPALAPLAAYPRGTLQLAGVDLRLWMGIGRASFGAGVGTLGYLSPFDHGHADGPMAVTGAMPSVSFGVRYRLSDQQLLYADASRARSLGSHRAATLVTTNIGVEWKPSRPKFGFERGAFGIQLDSGYRLSVKVRQGRPVLYLRGQF